MAQATLPQSGSWRSRNTETGYSWPNFRKVCTSYLTILSYGTLLPGPGVWRSGWLNCKEAAVLSPQCIATCKFQDGSQYLPGFRRQWLSRLRSVWWRIFLQYLLKSHPVIWRRGMIISVNRAKVWLMGSCNSIGVSIWCCRDWSEWRRWRNRIKLKRVLIVGDFHWFGFNFRGILAVGRLFDNRPTRRWLVFGCFGFLVSGTWCLFVRFFCRRFSSVSTFFPVCLVDGVWVDRGGTGVQPLCLLLLMLMLVLVLCLKILRIDGLALISHLGHIAILVKKKLF